jgi:hypothetical protein
MFKLFPILVQITESKLVQIVNFQVHFLVHSHQGLDVASCVYSLMFIPCIIRRSRNNQRRALICITPIYILRVYTGSYMTTAETCRNQYI